MEKNQTNVEYGGFWVRLLALLIDSIIVSMICSPIFNLILANKTASFRNIVNDLRSLIFVIYSILMLYFFGATLGKMVFGLVVTSKNREKPKITSLIIRETIGKFLSAIAIGIGFFWAGFDKKKQTWHDKIAKTYIVYE